MADPVTIGALVVNALSIAAEALLKDHSRRSREGWVQSPKGKSISLGSK